MPIRAEEKHRYPKDWKQISLRIRDRAGQKCEQCFAPNGKVVMRGEGSQAGTYMLEGGEVHDAETGEYMGTMRGSEYTGRFVRIVLTVAHMDHQPENNADDNLKALCQRCHLAYDAQHHKGNAARTRHARKAVADLFS